MKQKEEEEEEDVRRPIKETAAGLTPPPVSSQIGKQTLQKYNTERRKCDLEN